MYDKMPVAITVLIISVSSPVLLFQLAVLFIDMPSSVVMVAGIISLALIICAFILGAVIMRQQVKAGKVHKTKKLSKEREKLLKQTIVVAIAVILIVVLVSFTPLLSGAGIFVICGLLVVCTIACSWLIIKSIRLGKK